MCRIDLSKWFTHIYREYFPAVKTLSKAAALKPVVLPDCELDAKCVWERLIIPDWGFRVCPASSHKESLAVGASPLSKSWIHFHCDVKVTIHLDPPCIYVLLVLLLDSSLHMWGWQIPPFVLMSFGSGSHLQSSLWPPFLAVLTLIGTAALWWRRGSGLIMWANTATH